MAGTDFKFTISGKLHSSFVAATKGAGNNIKSIDGKLDALKGKFAETRNSVLALAASGYALGKAYGGASKVLKAQGELASLKISEKGIKSITKAGQEMALKFGQISAPAFVRASYDIKSGISSLSEDGVRQFTKLAATTAVATKASVGEMTKLMSLGYGIFRQDFGSDVEFGNKFSGAVAAAVESFRTDGSDLSQGLSNLGGTATAMGISMAEQFAVIGMAKETYATANEAATGYRAFLNSAGKAQEKLGMDFTDSAGKMLPFADILEMIKNQYGDMDLSENVELAEALGGTEAAKFLTSMIDKTDKLRKSTDYMSKSMEGGVSKAEQMAMAMDRGQGLEKLGNAFSYLTYTVGKSLEPVFNGFARTIGVVARGLAWVDEKASFLIPTIMGVTFAVAGTLIALKTAKLASMALSFSKLTLAKNYWTAVAGISGFDVAAMASRFSSLKAAAASVTWGKALRFLGGGFKSAALAVRAFGIAFMLNPVGAAITGIVVGAALIYKFWQPIKAFMGGVWDGFSAGFAPIKPLFSALASAFSPVINAFKAVFGWLGKLFEPIAMAEDKFTGFASTGEKFGAVLAGAFKVAFFPLYAGAKVLGWVSDKIGGLFGGDTSTKYRGTLHKKAAIPVAASVIMASQLAAANPTQPPVVDFNVPNSAVKQAANHTVNQDITVDVVVNNPSSNVDVERAIANGLRQKSKYRGTSLSDEVI